MYFYNESASYIVAMALYNSVYVTGFAKTVPIGTTIEIHFMA